MLIDLHSHSTASDGSYTPEDLIDFAIQQGIGILALCDHDTTAGLKRFISYGKEKNITPISGIEISATWKKGNCHITGLGVMDNYEPLESVLKEIRESRDNRNVNIIKKLNSAGVAIGLDEVEQLASGEVVARPHIARIMVNNGYVATVQEAFDKYLAKGCPAYVDRYRLEPEKAVKLLCDAGALPVLAHPTQLLLPIEQLDMFVKKLKPHGLAGIEVYTPYANDHEIKEFLNIAKKIDLYICGGSDFHGVSKPKHKLGYYRDNKAIPATCKELVKILNAKKIH